MHAKPFVMKKKLLLLILCLVLATAAWGCDGLLGGTGYTRRSTMVFSGSINFVVDMLGKNNSKAYDEMLATLQEINKQININDPQLETGLLKFNRAKKDIEIEIGYHAYYLLQKAKELYVETNGAFNVAAYHLAYLWGVDAISINIDLPSQIPPSFKDTDYQPQEKPTYAQIQQAKALCDLNQVIIEQKGEAENKRYYAKKLLDGLMVDLGGIAKGYAADLCANICKKYQIESACIDISGNLYLYGKYYDAGKTNKWKDYWTVGVNSPKTSILSTNICAFKTNAHTTAVTSGDYERFRLFYNDFDLTWSKYQNGEISYQQLLDSEIRACHIIDADRGMPYNVYMQGDDYFNTQDHIISCTIIADSSMYADAYSTAVCVMGLEKGVKFLSDKGLRAVIFTSNKKMALVGGVELAKTDVYNGYQDYADINNNAQG